MKRYAPFIIVVTVALITLGSATMLYRRSRPVVTTIPKEMTSGTKEGDSIHVRGHRDASVTVEEFADFQCPPCSLIGGLLSQLEKDFDGRLRVIFRHFPLQNHQYARDAALAAEAAGLQAKFWEMHDQLYREQAVWSKGPDVRALFNGYAQTLGLDVEQFKKDMASPHVISRVAADIQRGTTLRVTNTPTLFVNNKILEATNLNPAGLRAAIEANLKPAEKEKEQPPK